MDFFSSAIADLHLLNHPFYQAWMAGELTPATLREYATQYYFHVDRFPRYLSSIHSMAENPTQRKKILENLNEEEGVEYGVSHPELWLQFAEGLGVPRSQVLEATPGKGIENVTTTFFRLSRASFQSGLGALFAYESQVPEVADSKINGLRSQYGICDEATLKFFEVHRTADVEHRKVLLDMLEDLPSEERDQAVHASREAAQSLWDFLSEVFEQRLIHA